MNIMLKINSKIKSNAGISLVEIMVSIMIFSIVAAGLYSTATVGEDSWHVNKAQIELQQELRKSMERMINELRQASAGSIVDVPANDSLYIDIAFKIPSGVTSGTITWPADTIQYKLGGTNSNQLQRVSGGTTDVLSTNIQTLNFKRGSASPDNLEVFMVAQMSTDKGITISESLDFSVQLRN